MKFKKDTSEKVGYLNSLVFNENLKNSFAGKYIRQIRFVILLIASIVLLGLFSFFSLPRRLNPEIKIPIVTIVTTLPGATPQDIESLLTVPIEDKLNNIKGIDTLTSVSSQNVSVISVLFTSSTDANEARNDVDKAVSSLTTLPSDATDPRVEIVDFDNQAFWSFVIYTKLDTASLMKFATNLQEKIEDLSKVNRVEISGLEKEFIQVKFDPEKLAKYKLNPYQLSQAIKAQTFSYPAGNINNSESSYAFSIDSQISSIDDLRRMRINIGSDVYKLEDLASIAYKNESDTPITMYGDKNNEPLRAVSFFVFKTANADIDDAAKQAKELVDKMLEAEGGNFLLKTSQNNADDIAKQFSDLFSEFRSTLILVFGLLFVFLGLRQAIIASLTIPLTFLATFSIIQSIGLTLNFLTMFALLIALGLLIDDTIVVVAAMTRYYSTGKFTPYEVGVLVWKDFIVPLWSTTITTIWAFVPLLLSSGIIGEFIKPIPIVVTAAMVSSTTIATFITIPLMMIFLDLNLPKRVKVMFRYLLGIGAFVFLAILIPKTKLFILTYIFALLVIYFAYLSRKIFQKWFLAKFDRYTNFFAPIKKFGKKFIDQGAFSLEKIAVGYMKLIRSILISQKNRRQTLVAIAVFVVLAYFLVIIGQVKSEFFPKTDENLLFVSLEMPVGTSIAKVNAQASSFLQVLKNVPEAEFVTLETGKVFDSSSGNRSNKNNASLATITLPDRAKRERTSQEIAESLRLQLSSNVSGKVLVQELSGGPPAGADVQVNLLGADLAILSKIGDDFESYLKKQAGIINPSRSILSGTGKIVFVPDPDKMANNNVTVSTLGLWLRAYASGIELDTLQIDEKEVPIKWQFFENMTPEQILSLSIPSGDKFIPLSALGSIQLKNNPTQITRENGQRLLSIFASAQKGYNINELNANFIKFAKDYQFPEGYSFKTGGVNEENEKSVQSILQAMVLSGLLILITMIIEFQSFRQAFLALIIIPISIAGVFYIFGLTGIPLSFPALIGILALFGIVVTHAIVVIEKINDNRHEGLSLIDAIVDAAGNRLEPVVLTSLSTIFGLIPITIADPLWQGLGGAIIAGLLFSGAIKLFLVPILYYNFYAEDLQTK